MLKEFAIIMPTTRIDIKLLKIPNELNKCKLVKILLKVMYINKHPEKILSQSPQLILRKPSILSPMFSMKKMPSNKELELKKFTNPSLYPTLLRLKMGKKFVTNMAGK